MATSRRVIAFLQVVVLAAVTGPAAVIAAEAGAPAAAAATTNLILGNATQWRCWYVVRAPEVRVGQEIKQVVFNGYGGVWVLPDAKQTIPAPGELPAATWTALDFDDQNWSRTTGPFFKGGGWAWTEAASGLGFCGWEGTSPTLAAICLRGKFNVPDPAKAPELKLSLAYRGGVVVYLNGQEVARASIPDSEKAKGLAALAEDCPKEVFVGDDGKIISDGYNKYFGQLPKRIRKVGDVALPARLLRKGVNVLAIEVHRAPHHEAAYGAGPRGKGYLIDWCTVGLPHVALIASGAGVDANLARPAGVQVWNQNPQVRALATEYGDPCEQLKPVKLVGARNGFFSGEVVIGSAAPLRGLKAVAGDLTGAGKIPAASVQVRFAMDDTENKFPLDALSPEPPAEVAPGKSGGAVVPVWITVQVPADAKAGDYKGTVTLSAEDAASTAVPMTLRVVNWQLPNPTQFVSHVGLAQSPESVAMKYKVPLWSPEHWKLLDQTFALLAQVGTDDIYITALRRTHFGNEHGMIRWIKQADGSAKPDLTIAQQYLDLAIKHLGRIPVVCLYCWEPYTGGSYGGRASTNFLGALYTLVDPATGALEEKEGPKWGTPEVREFWKPVFQGLQEIMTKRGLTNSLMVGIAGDSIPVKAAVEDIKAVAPDVKWVAQTHMRHQNLHNVQQVAYLAEVWNSPRPPDPAEKRLYGWQNPWLQTVFPRYDAFTLFLGDQPLAQYRLASEGCSTAGIRGFGRVGADFWNVLERANKTYGGGHNLIARYPESDWAQLYLANSTPYVLAPGPKGPLATARFEMLRAGAQDLEARVFLEQALLDPAQRAKLGDEFARRCEALLDARVRANVTGRASWKFFQGGPDRVEQLYELAGEAAGRLGR